MVRQSIAELEADVRSSSSAVLSSGIVNGDDGKTDAYLALGQLKNAARGDRTAAHAQALKEVLGFGPTIAMKAKCTCALCALCTPTKVAVMVLVSCASRRCALTPETSQRGRTIAAGEGIACGTHGSGRWSGRSTM